MSSLDGSLLTCFCCFIAAPRRAAPPYPVPQSFYYMLQKPQEAADVAVLEAYQCDDFKDRLAGLGVAQEFYEKDKANLFSARATEEEILLLKIEREQEVKTGESGLVDLSVTQLMERYIVKGDVSRTQQAHARAHAHTRAAAIAHGPCCSRISCAEKGPLLRFVGWRTHALRFCPPSLFVASLSPSAERARFAAEDGASGGRPAHVARGGERAVAGRLLGRAGPAGGQEAAAHRLRALHRGVRAAGKSRRGG